MTERPDERARPRYGEYADTPPEAPQGQGPDREPLSSPHTAAPASPTPGRLPGVPHNLGVNRPTGAAADPQRGATAAPPQAPAGTATPGHGEPYRATTPPAVISAPDAPARPAPGAPAPVPVAGTQRPRTADRVITIVLLVLGAYGALNSGFSLLNMHAQIAEAAAILGLEDFTVAEGITTLGTVGAIIILALYAVVLIFSVQRLRAGKLTFWVPLSAGVLSVIVVMVFVMIGFTQSPELMQAMSDPDAMQHLMEYLQNPGT